jgi:FkbM family methyltransferase
VAAAARRALGAVPEPLKERLRMAAAYARLTRDRESLRRFADARHAPPAADATAVEPVAVRARALGGRAVLVRPGTSDVDTLWDALVRRYHVPPPEARADGRLRLILDLGANIGLTVAHLAQSFPAARVIGVELDAANVALAQRNTAPWAERCEIREGAVWPHTGPLEYHGWSANTSSFRVRDEPDSTATVRRASGVSLSSLIEPETIVDYVKMDIEGAEARVLAEQTDWAPAVRTIKVEVHPPYTTAECARDLEALGFRTRPDRRHSWAVVGVRPGQRSRPPASVPARAQWTPPPGRSAALSSKTQKSRPMTGTDTL